jgi:hypothetical protein
MEPIKEPFVLQMRGYSLHELSRLYNMSDRTFKKWIKPFYAEIGERQGRFFNVAQVKVILAKLGMPGETDLKNGNVEHNPEILGNTVHNLT